MKTLESKKTATWFELTNGYCGVMSVPDNCEFDEEFIEHRAQRQFGEDVGVVNYRTATPKDIAHFKAMGGYLA